MASTSKLKIKLVKSLIGRKPLHLKTIRGLGLRKINHVVELANTPEIRGMVNQVSYLVSVEECK